MSYAALYLSVVRTVCDRVLVMNHGEIVESGSCAEVFSRPRHCYTRELILALKQVAIT